MRPHALTPGALATALAFTLPALTLPALAQAPTAPFARVITDGDPATPDDLVVVIALGEHDTLTDVILREGDQASVLTGSFRLDRDGAGRATLRLDPAIALEGFVGYGAVLELGFADGRRQRLPLFIESPQTLLAPRSARQLIAADADTYPPMLPLENAGNLTLLGVHDAEARALAYRDLVVADGGRAALVEENRPLAGAPHAYAARYRLSPGGRELAQPLVLAPTPADAFTGSLRIPLERDPASGAPAFTLAGGINVDLVALRTAAGPSVLERFERRPTAQGDLRLVLRPGQTLADLADGNAVPTLTVLRRAGGQTLTQQVTLTTAGGTPAGSAGGNTAGSPTGNGNAPATTPSGSAALATAPGQPTPPSGNAATAGTATPANDAPTTPRANENSPPRENSAPRRTAAARALSGPITRHEYDALGHLTATLDPLGNATRNTWDKRYRPLTQTLPAPGDGSPAPVVRTGHDALDRLATFTDPRGLTTTYTYDVLDQVTQLTSPDTGLTRSVNDAAGNPVSRTDARGQAAQHSYDALNRLVASSWPGATGNELKTVAYTWDSPRIGALGAVEEHDAGDRLLARTTYTYDAQGRRTSETRTLGATATATPTTPTTLGWTYAAGGRLQQQTYPSGRTLAYSHDAAGRITAIATTAPGGTQRALATAIAYDGLGRVRAYTLGNGQTLTRPHDALGRVQDFTQGNRQITLTYDAASRIVAMRDAADPTRDTTYTYDALGRLTSATRGERVTAYTWDAAGNRLTRQRSTPGTPAASDTYTPATNSNRLASLTPAGSAPRPRQYDAAGNLLTDGSRGFTYDARGRLAQAILAASVRYQVDVFGRRIVKRTPDGDTVFHYDPDGRLIAEAAPDGSRLKEYVWLNDLPVAVLVGGAQ